MDVRLFTSTPGYASGAALGATYFCGFAGIWLVFAIFFQQGLGYSPLHAGLLVTPFAIGSAVSAALAGRLVGRLGRKLTVTGLSLVAAGLTTVAILAWLVPVAGLGPALTAPLLVTAEHGDYPGALGVAMLCSVSFIVIALALGIFEQRAHRTRRSADQLQQVTMAAPSE